MLSGQVAVDETGAVMGGDVTAQATHIFENVARLFEELDFSLESVLRLTTYLISLDTLPEYLRVYQQYFSWPFPAATAIPVGALVVPGALIEIDVIGVRSGRRADVIPTRRNE